MLLSFNCKGVITEIEKSSSIWPLIARLKCLVFVMRTYHYVDISTRVRPWWVHTRHVCWVSTHTHTHTRMTQSYHNYRKTGFHFATNTKNRFLATTTANKIKDNDYLPQFFSSLLENVKIIIDLKYASLFVKERCYGKNMFTKNYINFVVY